MSVLTPPDLFGELQMQTNEPLAKESTPQGEIMLLPEQRRQQRSLAALALKPVLTYEFSD